MKKVGFIGATGMLGRPVANALVNAGFEVQALVRDVHKASTLLPASITLAQGDIRDKQSLHAFVRNQDILYLNLSVKQSERKSDFHTESEGMALILDVARREKVQHIAYLSSLIMRYQGTNNFRWWVFEVKQNAVDQIKQSGIPYSIFYPSTFMESLPNIYQKGSMLMLAGKSKHKMYFIGGQDYGMQVARALQFPLSQNHEYIIQGPEAFTADEAIREYKKYHWNRKLWVVKSPLAPLRIFAPFSGTLDYAAHIIEALNSYPETFQAEDTWAQLGKPQTTIQTFTKSLRHP